MSSKHPLLTEIFSSFPRAAWECSQGALRREKKYGGVRI